MKRLGVVIVTWIAVLALAECAVTIFVGPTGRKTIDEFEWMIQDPVRGWMNLPGYRHSDRKTLRINSLGLRGPEFAIPKPPGVLRILCLGDSATFGIQGVMPSIYDGNYPETLASLLSARGATRIEIVNAGVIGYSSSHGLRFLATTGLDLEPDIVTVRFGFNDHVPSWNPPLRQAESRNPLFRELLYATHDLELVRLGLNAYQSRPSLHPEKFSGPWVSPEEFEYNLQRIVDLSRDTGAHVLFIDYPLRRVERGMGQMEDRWLGFWGNATLAEFHEKHYGYQQIASDVASANGVPVVETRPLLEVADPPGFDDIDLVHPIEPGVRIIANAVLDRLVQLDWIPAENLPAAARTADRNPARIAEPPGPTRKDATQ